MADLLSNNKLTMNESVIEWLNEWSYFKCAMLNLPLDFQEKVSYPIEVK